MSRYEVLLFLHLIGAFASVATVVLLTTFVLATRGLGDVAAVPPVLRVSTLARRLFDIGGLLTLVFGVWLALDLDAYGITDAWILIALALWVVAAGAGMRVGAAFDEAREGGQSLATAIRSQSIVTLHVVMSVAILALLVVMVYKPGA